MLKMIMMLDFSIKGYVISNKQFKLEKKQCSDTILSQQKGLLFIKLTKLAHLLIKRTFLRVVFYAEHDSVVRFLI